MNVSRNHNSSREGIKSNCIDLQNNIVKDSDIAAIVHQTGVNDTLLIKRTLIECENNISSTIIRLLSGTNTVNLTEPKKEHGVFDEIRKILNEKDAIYHHAMSKST